MRIAVLGAGNGGQAMAGHLASIGHLVTLYDRNEDKVRELNHTRTIKLFGEIQTEGNIEFASTNLLKVIQDTELIMVTTTATAHRELALKLAPILSTGQIIVLNPGRTCGALEFHNSLTEGGLKTKVYVAEAQTLIYACRLICNGNVKIIGVKDRVLLAAYPASDTPHVIGILKTIYTCFYPAANILQTSFENVGAILHPTVVLFNEGAIERGHQFYFYRDMTDGLARMIEQADKERLTVAQAYGCHPISVFDWISYAYNGVSGDTLCERMHNNPAYNDILAPTSINCRQITEDIPTGIIPFAQLGKTAGIATPLFDSLISMCSFLLKHDFMSDGRTLERLGLTNLTVDQIIKKIH